MTHRLAFALLPLVFSTHLPAEPVAAIRDEYRASLKPVMPLEEGWAQPPLLARTRVWWWWLNGNTDKETITRDLEAMKANGLGGANVIDAGGDNQEGNRRLPRGPLFGSPEWRELFRHAVAEADRLGLELGFNIQSGWNLGGPTVTAAESSKKVTFSRTQVEGGSAIETTLPEPPKVADIYQDVAVLAVPLARESRAAFTVNASSSQQNMAPLKAADDDPDTFWVSDSKTADKGPKPSQPQWIGLNFDTPVSADRLVITPRAGFGPKSGIIQIEEGGGFRDLMKFAMDRKEPSTIRFPKTSFRSIRILCEDAWDPVSSIPRNVQIAEISLWDGTTPLAGGNSGGGAIRNLDQKAYFKYPGAFTAAETWHLLEVGPESAGDAVCEVSQVVDLTEMMDASGKLRWTAPAGRWEILRFGFTISGAHVSTHSEGAGGHAIDYLDEQSLDAYWKKALEPIFAEIQPYLGKSLRYLHTDSWELGPVNWTRRMPEEFQRLRNYEIKPWLPVLAGHVIGSRSDSTRFLNDFRRTLGDLMAENKYKGFSKRAHAMGLAIHPESGGPHAGPMDALRNLGISDVPMGECWSTSPRHRVRDEQRFFVKQTTSAAHTYGRRLSLAEAFTNIGRHWQHDPRSLKPTFDQAACEGHNLTMWHTFPSSAKVHGMPGAAYFAGEHFNPNITWWKQGKAFVEYMNRCHFMLQQGLGTSDVLHFYGENIPAFVRLKSDDPAKCMPGYDYDIIDKQALLERVTVDAKGNAVLPEGTSYKMISLVPYNAVSLPVLKHLAGMVEKGLTLVGPRPSRQYSLSGGAVGDAEFQTLCDTLWGEGNQAKQGMRSVGKGRVIWGKTTREVMQEDGLPEDFSWKGGDKETLIDFIQRRTDDARVYFIANRRNRPEDLSLQFRITGFVPELWDPVTGNRRELTDYRFDGNRTVIPYPMGPEEAFFVVFRK
nr:discoidin domain-containing protein [Akkermansiaceae bacterium]